MMPSLRLRGDLMTDTAMVSRASSTPNARVREALLGECRRVEEYSKWSAAAHFTASSFAATTHAGVGILPIALGAVGTWSGLKLVADQTTAILLASIASLLAGIMGSVLSFWNMSEVRQKHFKAGAAYKTLENEARRAHSVFVGSSEGELQQVVTSLTARYDRLGEESAQSGDLAFWWASRKVRAGKYDPDA